MLKVGKHSLMLRLFVENTFCHWLSSLHYRELYESHCSSNCLRTVEGCLISFLLVGPFSTCKTQNPFSFYIARY